MLSAGKSLRRRSKHPAAGISARSCLNASQQLQAFGLNAGDTPTPYTPHETVSHEDGRLLCDFSRPPLRGSRRRPVLPERPHRVAKAPERRLNFGAFRRCCQRPEQTHLSPNLDTLDT